MSNTPMIVREKFDELIVYIDELHREINKTLDEDVAGLDADIMERLRIDKVRIILNHARAMTVSYRNLIANEVDIGHRR